MFIVHFTHIDIPPYDWHKVKEIIKEKSFVRFHINYMIKKSRRFGRDFKLFKYSCFNFVT